MNDSKPHVYVPRSNEVSRMIEVEPLSIRPRAQRVGIVLIAPRTIQPAQLMTACVFWPKQLHLAGVSRVAVLLGVEAYLAAKPIVASCQHRMYEQRMSVEYFHEGHLESDQITAWFEQRKPRRRVTTDAMMKLSERYAERGDVRAARQAARLAEVVATASGAPSIAAKAAPTVVL